MPALSDGAFRTTRFFSFFGLIVSVLGLRRRLPAVSVLPVMFRSPAPPPRATCGMVLTVSVSTIMFLADPSCTLALEGSSWVNEFLDFTWTFEGFVADSGFVVVLPPLFPLDSLCPPLSLPLSTLLLLVTSSSRCSLTRPESTSFAAFSPMGPRPSAGVEGKLTSWTVSSAGPLALIPLAGVRIPEGMLSLSGSDCVSTLDLLLGVARSRTMLGVTGAGSAFFDGKLGVLLAFAGGGGDLTLGGLPLA